MNGTDIIDFLGNIYSHRSYPYTILKFSVGIVKKRVIFAMENLVLAVLASFFVSPKGTTGMAEPI